MLCQVAIAAVSGLGLTSMGVAFTAIRFYVRAARTPAWDNDLPMVTR